LQEAVYLSDRAVHGSSLARITGSILAGGMGDCFLWMSCFVT